MNTLRRRDNPLTARRLRALRAWATKSGPVPGYDVADGNTNNALERAGYLRYVMGSGGHFEITEEGRARVAESA